MRFHPFHWMLSSQKYTMANPPKLFLRFFRWFCHPDLVRPIEGDLMELYDERVQEIGKKKADRKFIWDVVKLFRKDIIKPASGTYRLTNYGMIKNYFKVTVRNLFRQKLYSAINIGGLSIGITSFLLIFVYVQFERSFDNFYPNSDNIYHIYQQQPGNHSLGTDLYAVTPAALASTLMAEYPEVKYATTIDSYSTLLEGNGNYHYEPFVFGDEQFFHVFKHKFIVGDPKTALRAPDGAVLTASFAKRMFKDEDPMGKEVKFWAGTAYVTGVIQDPPRNSSFRFSAVLSLRASKYYRTERAKEKWNGNSYYTFLTFQDRVDPKAFEAKMKDLLEVRWIPKDIVPNQYFVQPLSELHLRSKVNAEIGIKGNASQLRIFTIIAILILTLAAINYMNLAVARSINRAKEVGLRKAIGARKTQLIVQFLTESVFLSVLALVLALGMMQLILPIFGRLVERQMEFGLLSELNLIPILFVMVFLLGIISGSYPALFMSSLRPVHVLKGKLGKQKSGGKLQKLLIICQYSISIIMLICTLIAYQQMRFISSKDLGISKDQIVIVRVRGSEMYDNIEVIKDRYRSFANVQSVSSISSFPTDVQSSTFLNADRTGGNIYRLYADDQFLEVFGVELLAGRFLDSDLPTANEKDFVINETAAKVLGWTAESAIGQEYIKDGESKNIIGVVADFHMHTMHLPIAPLIIGKRDQLRYISIKVGSGDISKTLGSLQEVAEEYSNYPFDYEFMDDHFDQIYKEDQRQGQLLGFFTLLAMVIAGLGLFGLAAFEAVQNQKEVGIRKVLGATVQSIVWLFGKKFISLVTIGFIIAVPASWFLIKGWLQNFAYRITPSWWVFGLGGAIAVLIAFATISSQSIKAALINPVESLKNE